MKSTFFFIIASALIALVTAQFEQAPPVDFETCLDQFCEYSNTTMIISLATNFPVQ